MWPLRRTIERGSFQLGDREVVYSYAKDSDILRIRLSQEPIARTLETEIGLVDLDADGEIVQIEVFAASKVDPAAITSEPFEREGLDLVEDLAQQARGVRETASEYVSETRERVRLKT